MFGSIVHNSYDALALIVLFGFTIFVHELGHFFVARRCGMIVETFSIGFGPAIWKRKVNGIVYKLGCIPFGGYVALPQLDPSGMETIQGSNGETQKRDIPPAPPSKKMLVSVAGAGGNILLAFALAWIIYLSPETATDKAGTLVGYVATNSPAYLAGLQPGDQIVAVNGEPITTWNEFLVECHLGAGKSNTVDLAVTSGGESRVVTVPVGTKESGIRAIQGVDKAMLCVVTDLKSGSAADVAGFKPGDIVKEFGGVRVAGVEHFVVLVAERDNQRTPVTVQRYGKAINLVVTPKFDADRGRAVIGVVVSGAFEATVMPWMEYRRPMAQIMGDTKGIVRILRALVSKHEAGQAANALGGPVMISVMLWISIKTSVLNAIGFIRFLNVNLAILNLLPIPVLDGGHILFAAWEAAVRRRVNPKFMSVAVNACAALLIGAILILTFRDILRTRGLYRSFNKLQAAEQQTTNAVPDKPTNAAASPAK